MINSDKIALVSSRSVQGPDPDTNPDRVGQYNPEHRGRGCNWPGLEFRRGWVQSILLSDAPVCFDPICWLYGSQFDIKKPIEFIIDLWLRMENESRNSEEQSRKLIRIKNQWFVSTESESDSDDSVMIRIRIDTCNTYSTIETWPDSWHSVSDHGHLSPAVRTSGSRNLVGLQWHSLYQHVIWWRRSLSSYLARLWRLCWRTQIKRFI